MGSSRNHGSNIRAYGTGDWKYEDWSGIDNYDECLCCSLVELGNVVLKIVEFFQVAINQGHHQRWCSHHHHY